MVAVFGSHTGGKKGCPNVEGEKKSDTGSPVGGERNKPLLGTLGSTVINLDTRSEPSTRFKGTHARNTRSERTIDGGWRMCIEDAHRRRVPVRIGRVLLAGKPSPPLEPVAFAEPPPRSSSRRGARHAPSATRHARIATVKIATRSQTAFSLSIPPPDHLSIPFISIPLFHPIFPSPLPAFPLRVTQPLLPNSVPSDFR